VRRPPRAAFVEGATSWNGRGSRLTCPDTEATRRTRRRRCTRVGIAEHDLEPDGFARVRTTSMVCGVAFVIDEEDVLSALLTPAVPLTRWSSVMASAGRSLRRGAMRWRIHAREIAHHGLEVQQRFESGPARFRVDRGVGGVPSRLLEHIAQMTGGVNVPRSPARSTGELWLPPARAMRASVSASVRAGGSARACDRESPREPPGIDQARRRRHPSAPTSTRPRRGRPM